MAKVVVYSKSWCPFCRRALSLLAQKQVDCDVIDLMEQPEMREEMITRSGRTTVPQIFIGSRHIGGCDDLMAAEARGELDPLLQSVIRSSDD